jgi:DNA-binding NtrC family response regulator
MPLRRQTVYYSDEIAKMNTETKRLLLIDLDDARRGTRVQLLEQAGYQVDTRYNYIAAERLDREGHFDLVIVTLHKDPKTTTEYSDQLSRDKPKLPVLLLTDFGVVVPRGSLSSAVEAGHPAELMRKIAAMLAGSQHIRDV